VSFEEAQTAFADDQALIVPDSVHSAAEERFHPTDDEVIRLISARKADSSERVQYGAR